MEDILKRLRIILPGQSEGQTRLEEEAAQGIELLREAVIAMAEDGWLYCGVEGPSDAQEKCLKAYRRVMPNVKLSAGQQREERL